MGKRLTAQAYVVDRRSPIIPLRTIDEKVLDIEVEDRSVALVLRHQDLIDVTKNGDS